MSEKWAVITGASRGIGREYAMRLSLMDYNLLLVSNENIATDGYKDILVDTIVTDLSKEDSAKVIYNYTLEKGYDVEVLVNNAGIFFFDSLLSVNESVLDTMLGLHVVTLTKLCRYFGNEMKKRGRGYILNMGSASDILPYPGISTYAATKAYIKNFSIALSKELRPFGVHLMVVRPGAVATGLYGVTGKIQKLGINLGIIIYPEKLVKRALKKLFKSKQAVFVPRFVTNGYFLFSRVPWFILGPVMKKSSLFDFLHLPKK